MSKQPTEPGHGDSTRAVHSGQDSDRRMVTRAKTQPIYQTSVFVYDSLEQVDDFLAGNPDNYMYTRIGNPNHSAVEELLRDLEGGEDALFSASGMAAIAAALLGTLNAGDHLVASRELYGTTQSLLEKELARFGIQASLVDVGDLDAVRAAIGPNTRLIYTETASNPLVRVSDVPALAAIAREHGLKLLVDNTFLSPVLYQPLRDGADLVVHSTTKYLNGHSDATGGALVGDAQWVARARRFQINAGGSASPFESWLTFRGAKTLALRMGAHSRNALALAEALERHPQVSRVYYPGLPSHPDHPLARRLFPKGASGMLAFTLKGGLDHVDRLIGLLQRAEFAPSLAGVASSITHPGKTSHRALSPEALAQLDIHDGTVRVSVGIEDSEDIVADFLQALDAL
ncbi:trans-sulfuration enzyme family protein [Pseudomonas citronellolis]|uniref:trans-sulfuration enzyme family protein n=1 Tax=Pseudomonas citronellolis TaxID=53408 RepID=UPI0023E418FB|nr:aminotransferase class I/II-fold pyridoxal phosphate-dependent enzyme [Pseudomonas citronellolis]MDF3935579.1 aminotransferase class I/II-fold pyridoxal phosphate-dependent enzyme [Pseudomonas citronellolis]